MGKKDQRTDWTSAHPDILRGSFSVIINNITLRRARPSPVQNSYSFSVAIYPGYASHACPWCPILKRL